MTSSEREAVRIELARAMRDDPRDVPALRLLDRRAMGAEAMRPSSSASISPTHAPAPTTRALEDEACAICLGNIDAGAPCEVWSGRLVHVACGVAARGMHQ